MTGWQTFTRRFHQLAAEARICLDEREYEGFVETLTSWAAAEQRKQLDDREEFPS